MSDGYITGCGDDPAVEVLDHPLGCGRCPAGGQVRVVGPVCGRRQAVEQARRAEHEGAGADRFTRDRAGQNVRLPRPDGRGLGGAAVWFDAVLAEQVAKVFELAVKAGRVLDLYARTWQGAPLGEDDYVISADEKTSIQARIRRQASLPAARSPARTESEYTRGGALQYLAAWDVHRARVFGRCEPTTGIEPFGRLVAQVMTTEPYRARARVMRGSSGCWSSTVSAAGV